MRMRYARIGIGALAACLSIMLTSGSGQVMGQESGRGGAQCGARAKAQAAAMANRGTVEVTSALGRKLDALPDDDAVVAARKKLAADPKNASLVLALSQAEAGRRQYREAVTTCTEGLGFAPDSADLYIER